jgi:hypothetical protein
VRPATPPSPRFSDAERVETGALGAVREQQFGRLPYQHRGGPAQRRIGHDEDEAAPLIGFEGEIRRLDDQVAPALAAVEQGVAQIVARHGRLRGVACRRRRQGLVAGRGGDRGGIAKPDRGGGVMHRRIHSLSRPCRAEGI